MTTEWQAQKADQIISHEIELLGSRKFKSRRFCEGLIQAAYAVGALNDDRFGYWNQRLEEVMQEAA